jgi:hypothetical protein
LRAILSCQLDGLLLAKNGGQSPVQALRKKLIDYLCGHQSRFLDLSLNRPRLGKHTLGSVPGYVAQYKGDRWFYLTNGQLKAIIGTASDATSLIQQLVAEGMLDKSIRGRVVQRPIFRGGKGNRNFAWVHAFRAKIIA